MIDDIPVICAECKRAEIWSNKLYCLEADQIIPNSKPDWCPIRKMPERAKYADYKCDRSFVEGFNICLEEIEGK